MRPLTMLHDRLERRAKPAATQRDRCSPTRTSLRPKLPTSVLAPLPFSLCSTPKDRQHQRHLTAHDQIREEQRRAQEGVGPSTRQHHIRHSCPHEYTLRSFPRQLRRLHRNGKMLARCRLRGRDGGGVLPQLGSPSCDAQGVDVSHRQSPLTPRMVMWPRMQELFLVPPLCLQRGADCLS